MTLKGKTAVITGSNSGIGLGVAEQLAKSGANVVINSFTDSAEDHALAARIADAHGVRAVYVKADMSQGDECRALIGQANEATGSVDILVNNAGIQHVAAIDEFPPEMWTRVTAIILDSTFHCIAAALPLMRAKNWGRIVNIASAHGLTASPFSSAYVAAKHGQVGLTKVVALETAEEPITCNAICPGYVLTPLVENQIPDTMKKYSMDRETVIREVLLDRQPSKQFATVEQIGDTVAFFCSPAADQITGTTLSVDGEVDRALTNRKAVNLALQGGGAHGAFTWGALDRLLAEGDAIDIDGITATSAGAMNAAALKHGWLEDRHEGARRRLRAFWLEVAGLDGALSDAMVEWLRAVDISPALLARALEVSPVVLAGEAFTRALSPYQFNPFNYHPMRHIVERMFDYTCVCSAEGPKLFISATNVRSGKVRVFQGDEITPDAILASACLPTLYQAIEIDDPRTGRREAYWDGGYMGNPSLYPLFYRTACPDIVIVHINPLERDDLPHTSQEILNRINEISFNASLLRELRGVDFVNRLIEGGVIADGAMKRNFVHSVRDDALMGQLGLATKLTPNKPLLLRLHDAGAAAMDAFLEAHWDDLGTRSSVDLRAMFSASGAEV